MLYYIYSLMTRVLSLEKRDINSNFCAQSVKQDLNRRPHLPGKCPAHCQKVWVTKYAGTMQVCIAASPLVFERQLSLVIKGAQNSFTFLTFIMWLAIITVLKYSSQFTQAKTLKNYCLHHLKWKFSFVFCFCFLFSCAFLTHTGLVSMSN